MQFQLFSLQVQGLTTISDSHLGPILRKWEKQKTEPHLYLNTACGRPAHILLARAGRAMEPNGAAEMCVLTGALEDILQGVSGEEKGK